MFVVPVMMYSFGIGGSAPSRTKYNRVNLVSAYPPFKVTIQFLLIPL